MHEGVRINGTRLLGFGADPVLLQRKYRFRELTHSNTFKRLQFERFVAKLAYCIVVKEYGYDRLRNVFVLDDLLGRANTLGTYFGSDHAAVLGKQPDVLIYSVYEDGNRRVTVRLKLFGNSDAPEYIVVVATLD